MGANYIKRLPEGVFGECRKLEKIGLSNNLLQLDGLMKVFKNDRITMQARSGQYVEPRVPYELDVRFNRAYEL